MPVRWVISLVYCVFYSNFVISEIQNVNLYEFAALNRICEEKLSQFEGTKLVKETNNRYLRPHLKTGSLGDCGLPRLKES